MKRLKSLSFFGSEEGMTDKQQKAFCKLLETLQPKELHHGDRIGGDAQAHFHGRRTVATMEIHVHPAKEVRRVFSIGNQLHKLVSRNKAMHNIVDSGRHLVIAPTSTIDDASEPWQAATLARQQHKTIHIIYPNGKIVQDTQQ
jgi:hypothetical protein